MASASTRRSLFAAAGAAVVGSGITAGLATSVADFAEPPYDPDAALITLCREYIEHSGQHSALCAKQDAMAEHLTTAQEAEWNRLDDAVSIHGVRMGELENEIPQLPAVTPAGQRAKAEALLHVMQHISPQHGGLFARSLARDLVGRAS